MVDKLDCVVSFVRIDFRLFTSFIESAAACRKKSPLFSSESISMCIFLSTVNQDLASGGILISVKAYISIFSSCVSRFSYSSPSSYKNSIAAALVGVHVEFRIISNVLQLKQHLPE